MPPSTLEDPQDGYVSTPGGRLHYLKWGGAGPCAHLLHANGFCAGTYGPFVRYLTRELTVFASDIRGHGGSDPLSHHRIGHWKIFAADLKELIASAIGPPVVGIGHSLGAVTTYIAAAQYPGLFSAIILIDPPILPRHWLWGLAILKLAGLGGRIPLVRGARRRRVFTDKHEALKRFLSRRSFKTWSKEFVEAYLECGLLEKDDQTAMLRCDPELEAQIFESIPIDVWRYGPRISCPVLTIRGAASDTFLPDAAARLGRIVPRCESITIPDAGHFVPMEQPEACAQAIVAFVRRARHSDPTPGEALSH
ncbi:MAG: alpha/beta hydrolase [Pseudomonadota bacterium]